MQTLRGDLAEQENRHGDPTRTHIVIRVSGAACHRGGRLRVNVFAGLGLADSEKRGDFHRAFCVGQHSCKLAIFGWSAMSRLFHLAAAVAALFFVAVAFIYMFNPKLALDWLKKVGIAFA